MKFLKLFSEFYMKIFIRSVPIFFFMILLIQMNAEAFVQKESLNPLDDMVFQRVELRTPATVTCLEELDDSNVTTMQGELSKFRLEHGDVWTVKIDER